jgi:hypothetical protein
MTLEIVVPELNKDANVKDLVFSILIDDTPKTLTQLHRQMKKQYNKSVSFQAIIKAVNSLLEHKVLTKEKRLYSINKDWIFETRNFFDRLYTTHFKVKKPMKIVELGKEVIIYTVHNLLELDRIWNDLLTNWANTEKENKVNCWQGKHCFWLIPRLQEEDILHDFMISQGIKTYNIIGGGTSLDKSALKYYSRKKEHTKIKKPLSSNDSHIAAFGNNILKFEIPKEISAKLEKIYQNTKSVEDLDLKHAVDVFKQNIEIEVTVIKDNMLSRKIQEDIIKEFK